MRLLATIDTLHTQVATAKPICGLGDAVRADSLRCTVRRQPQQTIDDEVRDEVDRSV
jgi:hypothetical protein